MERKFIDGGVEWNAVPGRKEVKERNVFTIKDLSGASWALRKINEIEVKEKEIQTLAAIERERIAQWEKKEMKSFESSKQYFEMLLEDYYSEQLAQDPKAKISTPYGTVTTRKQQPEWKYDDNLLTDCLRYNNLTNLYNKKEVYAVDKTILKKEVTIMDNVVSFKGKVKIDIEKYGNTGEYINKNTGEIYNENLDDFEYHERAIVFNNQIIDGVQVTERAPKLIIKTNNKGE